MRQCAAQIVAFRSAAAREEKAKLENGESGGKNILLRKSSQSFVKLRSMIDRNFRNFNYEYNSQAKMQHIQVIRRRFA